MLIDWACLFFCLGIIGMLLLLGHLCIKANPKYYTTRVSIQPPAWVYPICWNISILVMIFSMYSAWKSADTSAPVVVVLFASHFGSFLVWAYYNFQKVDFATATKVMGLVVLTLFLIMAYLLYTSVRPAVYALLLNFIWLIFCVFILSRLAAKLRSKAY